MRSEAVKALEAERSELFRRLKVVNVVLEKLGAGGVRRRKRRVVKKAKAKAKAEPKAKPAKRAPKLKPRPQAATPVATPSLEERRARARAEREGD